MSEEIIRYLKAPFLFARWNKILYGKATFRISLSRAHIREKLFYISMKITDITKGDSYRKQISGLEESCDNQKKEIERLTSELRGQKNVKHLVI